MTAEEKLKEQSHLKVRCPTCGYWYNWVNGTLDKICCVCFYKITGHHLV